MGLHLRLVELYRRHQMGCMEGTIAQSPPPPPGRAFPHPPSIQQPQGVNNMCGLDGSVEIVICWHWVDCYGYDPCRLITVCCMGGLARMLSTLQTDHSQLHGRLHQLNVGQPCTCTQT